MILASATSRTRPADSLEVERVGEGVARGHRTGAAGQGDLAEAEVLHAGRAVAADPDQDVAEASGRDAVGSFGRVARVHGGPLGEHLEVVDLRQTAGLHGLGRPGEEPGCVEVC